MLMADHKYDAALEELATAIACDPKNAAAHLDLGAVYAREDKLDAAIEEYNEAIALEARYALAHDNLASVLKVKGELNEAIAEYDEAVGIEPDNPTYLDHQKNALEDRARQPPAAPPEASEEVTTATLPQPP